MAKKKVDLVSLLTQRVAMDNMAEMRREIIGLSLSRKCLIYIITAFSPLGQDIFFLFRGFSPILMNYKTYHLNMANGIKLHLYGDHFNSIQVSCILNILVYLRSRSVKYFCNKLA